MPELKLAVTGFVSSASGSMAGANGLLLRALLDRGCRIDFFSKSSFVDPRPLLGEHPLFRFHESVNPIGDGVRRKAERFPLLGPVACRLDSATYHRALLKSVSAAHSQEPFDLFLWLGDYARGRVPGLRNIAFAQGPPGTDARAVLRHYDQIQQLSGPVAAFKWLCLARMRLAPAGLPPFQFSDHVIVGSSQSKSTLVNLFGFAEAKVFALPYPVDLKAFLPGTRMRTPGELRCLWLGRIVPRKRLDIFLSAAELAVSRGWDIRLTIAGDIRMVRGYERLIEAFPHPDRLVWRKHVPRGEVPELIRSHDVLIQPSEEEDFGSSVAEAQACGLPVIVGSTNGNRDYLSSRDIVLGEDSPAALCDAIGEVFMRREGPEAAGISRAAAEKYFDIGHVADQMVGILRS
jgi:glycosyltransferase involved in cell wall biosynthesis